MAIGVGASPNVLGQSLDDALALTYEANPRLAAARAELRATNETLAQAKRDWFRPTLEAKLSAEYEDVREVEFEGVAFAYSEELESYGGEITASLPLYRGGRTLNSIRAARSEIASSESELLETEQTVLSAAAVAYAQVVLYERLLDLSLAEEKAYEPMFRMVRRRLESQTGTVTDLSQVESRLSNARASVYQQRGGLRAARSRYTAIVTEPPLRLEPAPWIPLDVSGLEEALDIGIRRSPKILAAERNRDRARHMVQVQKGALLPSIDLSALYLRGQSSYRFTAFGLSDDLNDDDSEAQVALSLTIPIFNGGYNYSRVREARQDAVAARATVRRTQLTVRGRIEAAWYERRAQAGRVAELRDMVKAAQGALDGKLREYKDGATTMTELLLARRDLYTAQQLEARAKATHFARHVDLLSAIGWLTAKALDLPVERYDPTLYRDEVEDRWIGYEID